MNAVQTLLAQATAEADVLDTKIAGLESALAAAKADTAAVIAQRDTLKAALKTALLQLEAGPNVTVIRTDLAPPGMSTTDALQASLNGGGALYLPAGDYVLDPTKILQMVPGTSLRMAPGARLVMPANGQARYTVLRTADRCAIRGGALVGDRFAHDYSSGGTHEWGAGLLVVGVDVTVEDLDTREFTGDGIGLGLGTVRATLRRVTSSRNRRQAMSVYAVQDVLCEDCVFAETGTVNGQPGTNPQAGVDIEPDKGAARGITFRRCVFEGNTKDGVTIWAEQPGVTITGIVFEDCVFGEDGTDPNNTRNLANGLNVCAPNGSLIDVTVRTSRFGRNKAVQIRANTGALVNVDGCTFVSPLVRTPFRLTGTDSRTRYDVQAVALNTASRKGSVIVGTNDYS